MNPYVFIVGCPRSGTTLLQRIVDAHPEIAVLRAETKWIPILFEQRLGLAADGRETSGIVAALAAQPTFPKLGISEADLIEVLRSRRLDYAGFVSAVFDLYGARQGKSLVGDKTPAYVRSIRTLHHLWREARFVHLIRDGRDVGLSAMGWERKQADFHARFPSWRDDAVTSAAHWWRWHVESGRAAAAHVGPLYLELHYEELVDRPETACRRLCAFLHLEFDERMLRFHEGRTRNKPGLSAKRAWLPITPGLRDWRKDMPGADVEQFEAAAGELLDELGYDRAVRSPSPGAIANAELVGRRFAEDTRRPQKVSVA